MWHARRKIMSRGYCWERGKDGDIYENHELDGWLIEWILER
jgi:hypothetical protein